MSSASRPCSTPPSFTIASRAKPSVVRAKKLDFDAPAPRKGASGFCVISAKRLLIICR